MKTVKILSPLLVLIALTLAGPAPTPAAPAYLVLWGRHTQGGSPPLACNQIKLNRPASVEIMEGTARTYCFLEAGEIGWCGGETRPAVGRTLEPGVYSILPGLAPGQHQAYIRLYLKYVTPS